MDEAVQVGRLNFVATEGVHVLIAQIVGKNKQDIWTVDRRGSRQPANHDQDG